VEAQTADEFIRTAQQFFSRFEKPEALKMDNAAATIRGQVSGRPPRRIIFLFFFSA